MCGEPAGVQDGKSGELPNNKLTKITTHHKASHHPALRDGRSIAPRQAKRRCKASVARGKKSFINISETAIGSLESDAGNMITEVQEE